MWHGVNKVFTLCFLAAVFSFSPVLVHSFSQSDTQFYDGYGDLTGLDPARSSNVTLDILGGVRLTTVGVPVTTIWTNQADFTAPVAPLGPVIGLTTLDTATAPGSLQLAQTPLAFRRGPTGPVLKASDAVSIDGYSVGGMCVARVDLPDAVYYMWYTGVPENEWQQRLFLAKSDDGKSWVKEAEPVDLPLGDPGSFDSRQIFRPSVIYNAAATPKFKMWYSAEGDFGGSIGYATSEDGVTWTKVVGADGLTNEVLPKGDPGTADGLSCSEPSVLIDGSTYRMWYTASDGNNDRIAYATSSDGITWQKGSVVVDIKTGNTNCGANSPTVWKTDTGFSMILAGCKLGEPPEVKLIAKDSPDGTDWSQGNTALNFPNNAGDWFDLGTQTQPWVLPDPTDIDVPFKMWYVGSNPDDNGNFHNRIGYAESDRGGSFSGVRNPAGAIEPFYGAWLTLGTQSLAFDSMNTADLRPVSDPAAPTEVLGFYTGVNAADFKPRIGIKRLLDGEATWPVETGVELIDVGAAGAADAGGAATPAPFYLDGATPQWIVYYTATNGAVPGEQSIGYRITTDGTLDTISIAYQPFLTKSGAGFDNAGVADPYVVDTGSALAIYYAGKSGSVWSIGRVTASYDTPQTAAERAPTALTGLTPTAGSYDADGLRNPVVLKRADADWYLWYTAIDADGTERTALATSTDGTTWVKEGLAIVPSTAAYDFTEGGVRPAAAWVDGSDVSMTITGADRFGWTRCGLATASGPGYLESGTAAFELMNAGARDWKQILWTEAAPPANTTSEVWVSYYPTANGDFWSNAFQLTNGSSFPFLLNVQGLRWQVRMTTSDPALSPRLDDLSVSHAPVVYPATGQAVTVPVGPPIGRYLLSWGDLTIKAETSGSAGLTVAVLNAAGATLVPAKTVNGGTTTVALGSANPPVSAASGPLTLVFTFTGDTTATALLESVGASFTSTNIPSALTLAPSVPAIVGGGSATLAGVLTVNNLPAPGQTVTISARTPIETAYTPIGSAVTLADGSFSLAVAPTAITLYQADWAGGTVGVDIAPPATAAAQIDVSPAITMKLTKYSWKRGSKYRYPLGRAVIITGTMLPNHYRLADGVTPGTVVATLSKYAYNKRTRKYVWVKMKDLFIPFTSTGAFKKSWRPRVRARYAILPSFLGDADHAAGVGKQAIVTVF